MEVHAETRDRTGDLQIFSLTLSRLSYRGAVRLFHVCLLMLSNSVKDPLGRCHDFGPGLSRSQFNSLQCVFMEMGKLWYGCVGQGVEALDMLFVYYCTARSKPIGSRKASVRQLWYGCVGKCVEALDMLFAYYCMFSPRYPCSLRDIHVLSKISMFFPRFPCSFKDFHVLSKISMFSQIFPCSLKDFQVLSNISMFFSRFPCSFQDVHVIFKISMFL